MTAGVTTVERVKRMAIRWKKASWSVGKTGGAAEMEMGESRRIDGPCPHWDSTEKTVPVPMTGGMLTYGPEPGSRAHTGELFLEHKVVPLTAGCRNAIGGFELTLYTSES